MDTFAVTAEVLWGILGLCLVAAAAGVLLAWRGHRGGALTLLFVAAVGILAFSLAGGFSVGRFTAVLPVLLTGYAVGMGRGPATVAACLLLAAVVYLAGSWVLTPAVTAGGVLALLFGFWAIPLYLVAAVAAFGWTALNPPGRGAAVP